MPSTALDTVATKEAGGYVDVDYFRLGTDLSPESK